MERKKKKKQKKYTVAARRKPENTTNQGELKNTNKQHANQGRRNPQTKHGLKLSTTYSRNFLVAQKAS
jgi:hypothetical protein